MLSPFRIDVPQPVLDDLHDRLRRIRWPTEMDGGLDQAYLHELVEHWRDRYDWRASEAALNRLPQVRVEVGGVRIHAVHVPGHGPRPLPLVLSHGWPSTFAEFAHVVGPLADPTAHGGDPEDAFDVVVPSLPGYGFSEPDIAERYPHSPPGVDTHRLTPGQRVRVPAAVALFKARYPRQYVERAYTDLRRLTEMPNGGHFPGLEEPDLLVDDIRTFFRPLRGR